MLDMAFFDMKNDDHPFEWGSHGPGVPHFQTNQLVSLSAEICSVIISQVVIVGHLSSFENYFHEASGWYVINV